MKDAADIIDIEAIARDLASGLIDGYAGAAGAEAHVAECIRLVRFNRGLLSNADVDDIEHMVRCILAQSKGAKS